MYDNDMDLKNKIYQMFMIAPQQTELIGGGNLEKALKSGLGGVIFFTRNILTISQTKDFISQINKTAIIPPFIGIDEEGGRVERTENIFNGKKFLSAKYQAEKGLDFVKTQTAEIAYLLKKMGFNMNFAPVLDVNTNPQNPIIGERAYGESVKNVEKYAICAMQTYLENKIIPVGKHFPGHGDANLDSHLVLPSLTLNKDEIELVHIKPFKKAIEDGIPAIMVAHLLCPSLTKQELPSSLSSEILDYLRNELNFKGLIVSDDMQMGALQKIDTIEAVILGIKAGTNLFLYRESTDNIINLIEQVYEKVKKDTTLKEKVENSFNLIQEIKLRYEAFFGC